MDSRVPLLPHEYEASYQQYLQKRHTQDTSSKLGMSYPQPEAEMRVLYENGASNQTCSVHGYVFR